VIEPCVMVAEALPVLAIFTVCVTVVFRAELPKVTLDGVAVMVALPGVCGGAGVGVGEAEGDVPPVDAESAPLPPQPMVINIKMPSVTTNAKRKSCCAVVCCFKGVAPAFCFPIFALAWGP
jgi:hypothetical protein